MTIVATSKQFGVGQLRASRWKGASIPTVLDDRGHELDPLILAGPAPACLVERSGQCILLNAAMAAMLRLPVDQIEGAFLADFFPASMPFLNRWFALADAGKPLPDRQFAWDGRHYQVAARSVCNAALRFDGLSLTAFDITRRVQLEQRLRVSRRRLMALAHHDDLTGLLNRRGLELQLHRELRRALRNQRPLSLLMIDIDRFKAYNDTCGHLQGDSCLRLVSSVLRHSLRRSGDMAGRFGGEEFVVVLPDAGVGGAKLVAERLRAGVEALWLRHPAADAGHVTISAGVASLRLTRNSVSVERCCAALMQAADAALYRAKAAGRNRVESCAVSWTEAEQR